MFGRKKLDTTIEVPKRRVTKRKDGMYIVEERQDNGLWSPVSAEYSHSTSCYAALGRLTHRAYINQLEGENN